uniref:Uncharacterized protein n=1 Tax=Strigamia maritima TaxID=126957 RepID=T1J669_STRMM
MSDSIISPATATNATVTTNASSASRNLTHLDKVFADESDELKDMVSLNLSDDEEEDLDMMAKKIRDIEEKRTQDELLDNQEDHVEIVPTIHSTESTDDFIRNFMFKMGLTRTLDCFETEWQVDDRGLLHAQNEHSVPDMHVRCMELENRSMSLESDIQKFRSSAEKFKEKFNKVCKERDYHRMHHRRVVQEKNKLLAKIEDIQKHYSEYEPTLKSMQQQYEKAFRDRVLLAMEKEQMNTKMANMQAVLKNKGRAETTNRFTSVNSQEVTTAPETEAEQNANDSRFPLDEGFNPALAKFKNVSFKKDDFTPAFNFYAHSFAVTGQVLHENLFVTASDDFTWKLWPVPFGEAILCGKGHCEWLSDCAIGPKGVRLATTSGDCTVKIWDVGSGKCLHTFSDHQLAVWSCHWHNCGDFVASCSMDCTIRMWDINSLRCRLTLRGHKGSVNSVEFLSYSNILLSTSSDKTVALWDARTGFCGQTLPGHTSSVTTANFNLRGDTIASGDSSGNLKLWDIRTNSVIHSIDIGPTAFINSLKFDPAGTVL